MNRSQKGLPDRAALFLCGIGVLGGGTRNVTEVVHYIDTSSGPAELSSSHILTGAFLIAAHRKRLLIAQKIAQSHNLIVTNICTYDNIIKREYCSIFRKDRLQ